jgi:hypothetical protein
MTYIFTISVGDLQNVAIERIGRRLTNDELRRVKKGLQAGLEPWESVAEIAIDEVTEQ